MAILGSFLIVALWEALWPRRKAEFPVLWRRLANLGIWLFNIIIAAIIFLPPKPFHTPQPTTIISFIIWFLTLDLLAYWTHRAEHTLTWLWRLHALHHSDPDVDWTTSVRHHPIESLLTSAAYWVSILVLNIPDAVIIANSSTTFVLAVATHGNIQWPYFMEKLLKPIIITLNMHLIHHSTDENHLNTNFGSIFNWWDRLFGTLQQSSDDLTFGVSGFSRTEACTLLDMLKTPWRMIQS